MKEHIEKDLGINSLCFGCGEENPIGAKLSFYKLSDKSVGSSFLVPKTWGGWGKIVHGGLQTVLMDEVSGWTVITLLEEACLTIKVDLQFFKPLYVEEEVEIIGEIAEHKEKDILVKSYIKNKDGQICTQGHFTFRKVTKKKIEQIAGIKISS
ncbi:MAG: hypothetical protein GOP50_12005 [Candidatus Heimdallarchaeota archaeon]|nr:hypothetical protein [Candidatus Heimdallarchaeota archaeon]